MALDTCREQKKVFGECRGEVGMQRMEAAEGASWMVTVGGGRGAQ